jgi:proline dehydrogenase
MAAAWEVSRFAVANKLKTPFGGPVQTFEALEKMLHEAANPDTSVNAQYAKALLEFVEAFEKAVQSVCDSKASGFLGPAGAAHAFFVSNKKVCHDWFTRLRRARLRVASRIGSQSHIIRNASLLLLAPSATMQAKAESEMWLLQLASALLATGDADTIRGLIATTPQAPKWLSLFASVADGCLETALSAINEAIPLVSNPSVSAALRDHASEWFMRLGEWGQVSQGPAAGVAKAWELAYEKGSIAAARLLLCGL